jgi:alpha-mannosidase
MYMVKVHGQTTSYQEVLGRLTVATFPVEPVTEPTTLRVEVRVNDRPTTIREITIHPVIHRDIHLVHHSHTDIGYSHLQAEVETIQNNNIWKALELIDRTKDYPEGQPLRVERGEPVGRGEFPGHRQRAGQAAFHRGGESGSIALSANYANVLTGLCTPEEMHWIVEYADSLRKWYDLPITMAMQTDIPGMSWSMVDAYAAHGIRHLSQGPNYIPDMPDGGDRIGSTLREQGDKPYWWKGTTGKRQHPRVDGRSGLRRLARLHGRGDQGARHTEDRRLHERLATRRAIPTTWCNGATTS